MTKLATLADKIAIEAVGPFEDRVTAHTLYQFLNQTRDAFPDRPALSFQLLSGPKDKAETLTWRQLHAETIQTANMLRSLGIGEGDVVAFVLPNANETALTLLGGAIAGIVAPINPLLEPEQIAAILRDTRAKALVTLRAFPKTDVAQKAAAAVAMAPGVEVVLEVDLLRYLTPPKSWIVPLLRPKNPVTHKARVLDFNAERARHPRDKLTFDDAPGDRVAAYFHTGGTTGMPKVAQHKYSGMIYNGWVTRELLFDEKDVLICPLPLFHVFASQLMLMASIASGAHMVLPTPAGYRGDGVFDNFWKLVERWGVTFLVTVPTAVAALMQRPVDADVSSLKTALCGSAALPQDLFNRFQKATGVAILEGYGMTEATCLVSCNPYDGAKKIGSVGLPVPYTDVRILDCDDEGNILRECGLDEVGEICVSSPGVFAGHTYTDAFKNKGLFAEEKWLRTGDLGRIDADGYVWITGRKKDIIIRGGHNIDPGIIEEAMARHPAVTLVGAIGQPDAHSGEIPAVYLETVANAQVTVEELLEHARNTIPERAAVPRHVAIVAELPKTAVGKILKNELRQWAIRRVYDEALEAAGVPAQVREVVEDKRLGLVAVLAPTDGAAPEDAPVQEALKAFTRPWRWAG